MNPRRKVWWKYYGWRLGLLAAFVVAGIIVIRYEREVDDVTIWGKDDIIFGTVFLAVFYFLFLWKNFIEKFKKKWNKWTIKKRKKNNKQTDLFT